MPTYEYRCTACDHQFEIFQQMSDAVKRKCPECGKNKLERLIGTGAGIIFKGGGFYQTDYRSESYKKAAEAESKPPADSKSGSSSDTKPESKSSETASATSDSKKARTVKSKAKK